MGSISLSTGGKTPPFNVVIREVSELSGNRCTACTNITSLLNLPVNWIADGNPHMYMVRVEDPANNCHPGITQTTVQCSCEYLPTVIVSQSCNGVVPSLLITPSITSGVPLRIHVSDSSGEVHNGVVSSGSTLSIVVNNNTTYQVYVEVDSITSCKSDIQTITTFCEDTSCSINVTVSNINC